MSFNKYKILMRVPRYLLKHSSTLCCFFSETVKRHALLLGSTAKFTSVSAIMSIFSIFKKTPVTDDDLLMAIKTAIGFIQTDSIDEAEDSLKTALQIAKELKSIEGLIHVYDVMGNVALKKSEYDKAKKYFTEELSLFQKNRSKWDVTRVLNLHSKIAYIFQLQGDNISAQHEYKAIIEKIEYRLKKSETRNDSDLQELRAQTKKRLGEVQMKSGHYNEARKSLTDAYVAYEAVYGKQNVEVISVLRDLSFVCRQVADNNKAIKYLEEAIDASEKLKDDAEMAVLKAELGVLYMRVELLDKARNMCREALKIAKKQDNSVAIEKANDCLKKIREYSKKI